MRTRRLPQYLGVFALGVAAAALYGCSDPTPYPTGETEGQQQDPLPDQGAVCGFVDRTKLPAVAQWVDNFEGKNAGIGGWTAPDDTQGAITVRAGVGGETSDVDPSDSKIISYDYANSKTALHMKASMPDDTPHDADHWGINWQYEWPGGDGNFGAGRTTRQSFDWSEYSGLVLWVRWGGSDGSKKYVSVQLPTAQSLPASVGGDGSCIPSDSDAGGTGTHKCYSNMGRDVAGRSCWQPIKIPFSELTPVFTPGTPFFDKAHIFGIELGFNASSPTAYAAYWPADIWVDDIYLYKD